MKHPAAILIGFGAWLTQSETPLTFGSGFDASRMAELVKEYSNLQELGELPEGWENTLNQAPTLERDSDLRAELAVVLNRFSRENYSNTPDFILAQFLMGCLTSFDEAVGSRDRWYGVELRPGEPVTVTVSG